jgi:Periplasmic binding protein
MNKWRETQMKKTPPLRFYVWSLQGLLGATALGLVTTASTLAQAADPIKIGVIAEAQAIAGASIPQAAQMAADEINAKGGVDGRKIEIVTYDNHSSSADSVRAFQRAVNEDKVNIVIASYISEVVLALEPWASRLKTPFITPGAASNEISKSVHADYEKNKYTFHGYLTSAALALSVCDAAKDLLVDEKHMKTAVIMSEDAAWTKPLDVGYEECLPKIGLKVLDHIRFSPDLQQDRGGEARRDHHRHFARRRAADGAMEEPAGADPDARHQFAGDQLDLRQGYQRCRKRRALSGRVRPGCRGDAEVDPVRRRLQDEIRQLSVLCRLHHL